MTIAIPIIVILALVLLFTLNKLTTLSDENAVLRNKVSDYEAGISALKAIREHPCLKPDGMIDQRWN